MSISEALGERREAELPQGRIRFREAGSGPALLFLHGFLVNGDLWRKVVPPLARRARCITPDLPLGSHEVAVRPEADLTPPGIARLIADFMSALELEEVTVVGNDTGGALAQILVTRHPDRVGGLVLTPCDAFWNFPAWWSKPLRPIGFAPPVMQLAGRALRHHRVQRLPLAYGWVVKRHFPPEIAASFVENGLREEGVRRDFGRAFRTASPRHTIAAGRRLVEFGGRSLVVWNTEQARIYPLRHGKRLAQLLRAPLELVDDSYIYVPEDRPERLAGLLEAFLSSDGETGAGRG
jgi:pimeloyl-ACP methyl ester carboxylesterase